MLWRKEYYRNKFWRRKEEKGRGIEKGKKYGKYVKKQRRKKKKKKSLIQDPTNTLMIISYNSNNKLSWDGSNIMLMLIIIKVIII
jgi:hypothetical protein